MHGIKLKHILLFKFYYRPVKLQYPIPYTAVPINPLRKKKELVYVFGIKNAIPKKNRKNSIYS